MIDWKVDPDEIGGVCPPTDDLRAFILGKVTEEERQLVGRHIKHCGGCIDHLEILNEVSDSFFRAIRGEEPRPEDAAVVEELTNSILANGQMWMDDINGVGNRPVQLGEYMLHEVIGRGAMSDVYRAHHRRLQRTVVIKVLTAERAMNPENINSFRFEMATIGQLNHPNIVQATDASEDKGYHYLVMDYVKGTDLSTLLVESGPMEVADACEIICQTTRGLQAAHDVGVIHRDLKPSNLLLSTTGEIKILDLGLACFSAQEELAPGDRVVGTSDYMAPEQWEGAAKIDGRTDIYNLGCTFYKLLSGQAPFHSVTDVKARRNAHLLAAPPKLPNLPSKVAKVLYKMLEKRADDRFSEPHEIEKLLAPLAKNHGLTELSQKTINRTDLETDNLNSVPTVTTWHGSPPGRRFSRPLVAVGVMLMVVLSVGAYMILPRGPGLPLPSTPTQVLADGELHTLGFLRGIIGDVPETEFEPTLAFDETGACTYESVDGVETYRIESGEERLIQLGETNDSAGSASVQIAPIRGVRVEAGVFWGLCTESDGTTCWQAVKVRWVKDLGDAQQYLVSWRTYRLERDGQIPTPLGISAETFRAPLRLKTSRLQVAWTNSTVSVVLNGEVVLDLTDKHSRLPPWSEVETTRVGIVTSGGKAAFQDFSYHESIRMESTL